MKVLHTSRAPVQKDMGRREQHQPQHQPPLQHQPQRQPPLQPLRQPVVSMPPGGTESSSRPNNRNPVAYQLPVTEQIASSTVTPTGQ